MARTFRRFAFSTLFALPLITALGVAAQDDGPESAKNDAPPLAVTSVRVTPESPRADSLCRLAVTLTNRADRPVSALAFTVELDGVALTVYERQLFVETIAAAGESGAAETVVELYNFWTSESGRPAPADGTIDVRVTLIEARWLTRDESADGTEILTLGEAVPGLPVAGSTTVKLAR